MNFPTEANQVTGPITKPDTIQKCMHKRAALLRDLNFNQSSILSKLPPETLSRIFENLLNPLRVSPDSRVRSTYRLYLLKLCAVCSHWRRTARSSPQLWSFLALTSSPVQVNRRIPYEDYVDTSRHFFDNSGVVPLSIYISNWEYASDPKASRDVMELILKENPSRIGSFHFDSSGWLTDSLWRTVSSSEAEFTQLEELALVWKTQSSYQPGRIFRNSPRLRDVSLSLTFPGPILVELPWGQLTRIELRNTLPIYSFSILINSPRLVEYIYHQDWVENSPLETEEIDSLLPANSETLVFPHLQSFSWVAPNRVGHMIDTVLLTRFHFPIIRQFDWNVTIPQRLRPDLRVLWTDPRRLEWLSFGGAVQLSKSAVTQNIGRFSQLSVLYLKDIGSDSPVRFLYRLIARRGHDTLLPQLRRLKIEEIGPLDDCLSLAIRLAHSRRNGPLTWSGLEEEIDDSALNPYDPSSPYWKNHAQLEHLTLSWFSSEGLAWGRCQHHHALRAMVTKAKRWECSDTLLLDW